MLPRATLMFFCEIKIPLSIPFLIRVGIVAQRVSKKAEHLPLSSFPRKRVSRLFNVFLDPRWSLPRTGMRGGGDDLNEFFDTF